MTTPDRGPAVRRDREPPVSVCVPAFNGAPYIGEAIRSVLGQSLQDFELVVVDDGSSDGTAGVVAAVQDERLRLVRNPTRLGLVGNWNRCLDLARGRHVTVFHQDDVMAPDNLQAKLRFLEAHPSVGFVHSNVTQIDARGEVLSEYWSFPPTPQDEGRHDGLAFFHRSVTGVNGVCASSVMMRHETFERLGAFDPRLPFTADWEMWLRIALFYDIGYLTQPLVRYRRHDGMETARFSWCQQLEQSYRAKMLVLEKHPDRVPDIEPLRRRISREYCDRAVAQARKELEAGRPDLAGEYLEVALAVCERMPPALEQALWALESGVVGGGARQEAAFETIRLGQPFRHRLDKPAGTRRVLLMLSWLNVGGVEKFSLDLVGQLLERRHQVSVCTTLAGDDPWLPRFAELTPDIFSLPAFLRPPDFPRFLLYLIESRGIDVVLISNSYLAYQLLPFLRSCCPDVAFVDYVHMEAEHWRNGGFGRLSVAFQELLDLTVVTTEHLRRWLVQHGGGADRIEVCHANVDISIWNPARFPVDAIRRGLAVPDDIPMMLYAARIGPQKRPRLLAEVIRRLVEKEGLAFVCVVAGDGEDLPALRALVTEYGLESRVRFVGTVTSERMQELQAAADIFFLPSSYEGLSLVLYEAMAMETVPVAADVGGQRELVTPDCGILIPRGDDEVERYVAALRMLVEAPALRRAMAATARARVIAHFPLTQMGDRMVELLERATALARSSPRAAVGPGLGLECATLAIEYRRLETECETFGRRAAEAVATAENLGRRQELLESQLAKLRSFDVTRLSGAEIARSIGLRRIVQALAFRLASRPGLTWLRALRPLAKRVLGG